MGMAIGPALGSWLTVEHGIEWMFVGPAGHGECGPTWPRRRCRCPPQAGFESLQGSLIDRGMPQLWCCCPWRTPLAHHDTPISSITSVTSTRVFNTIIVVTPFRCASSPGGERSARPHPGAPRRTAGGGRHGRRGHDRSMAAAGPVVRRASASCRRCSPGRPTCPAGKVALALGNRSWHRGISGAVYSGALPGRCQHSVALPFGVTGNGHDGLGLLPHTARSPDVVPPSNVGP